MNIFHQLQIYKMHNNLLTYKTIPNGLKKVWKVDKKTFFNKTAKYNAVKRSP
jgi:hypothetical protein